MDKVAAGQQAAIERGQIKEAIEFVKADLLDKIGRSEPGEDLERQNYYFQYRAIDLVMARLQSVIIGGKLALKGD